MVGSTVGSFIDMEGPFNSTSWEVVCQEGAEHGVAETLVKWIGKMVKRSVRNLVITHGGVTVQSSVSCRCPQEGVL